MSNMQYRLAWPPLTPGVKVIGAVITLLWFLPILVGPLRDFISLHGILHATAVVGERPWTLLTHAFFEREFLNALFSVIALWLFGGELERIWGLKKWLIVQAIALAASGILVGVLMYLMDAAAGFSGWRAGTMALVSAYCIRQWNSGLNFFGIPMSGKIMLGFFVGISVLMIAFTGAWWLLGTDIAGVAVGYLALGGKRRKPGFWMRDLKTRWRLWRARRHLKVVKSNGSRAPEDDRKHFN